jgi:cytidine deaminase
LGLSDKASDHLKRSASGSGDYIILTLIKDVNCHGIRYETNSERPFRFANAAYPTIFREMFIGCNVEHRFRSHDVHAEVNAITSMITSGRTGLVAVVIAAERERFTPCGSCMDWIYQFGGPTCRVGYQSNPGGEITVLSAEELMPYYPR